MADEWSAAYQRWLNAADDLGRTNAACRVLNIAKASHIRPEGTEAQWAAFLVWCMTEGLLDIPQYQEMVEYQGGIK